MMLVSLNPAENPSASVILVLGLIMTGYFIFFFLQAKKVVKKLESFKTLEELSKYYEKMPDHLKTESVKSCYLELRVAMVGEEIKRSKTLTEALQILMKHGTKIQKGVMLNEKDFFEEVGQAEIQNATLPDLNALDLLIRETFMWDLISFGIKPFVSLYGLLDSQKEKFGVKMAEAVA